MKFDYKLLEALSTVIEQQSFELAARKLFISQSAVSQRIKLLEETVTQPVLIRSQPLMATPIGEHLLTHYKMVRQLEDDLLPELLPEAPRKPIKVSLAVNADSIATWFIEAITPILKSHLVELDLIIKNESKTIEKLRSGEAVGAVSNQQKSLPGYQSFYLGDMRFILVASPEFVARYFPKGIKPSSLKLAPGISYDTVDDMHVKFIEQHFKIEAKDYFCHSVRSSEAFVALAKQGAAYCLVPELQVKAELEQGLLVNLCPDKVLTQSLYWHSWVLVKGINKQISKEIVRYGQMLLCEGRNRNEKASNSFPS
ncbi:LysR family transcriptional regulator ArgP [Psychrobium sp. 1_MG-2023]|uniref:LysR family transcriptional regulator ArgP n=1 Tax=Psychrobium sp. 1_MG-2023 TaxID=3062624 RepID=UPI000C3235D6|nr:LysR family transcriptional regulator ArgP [Psychrobium sp. 1_MG-2023]MDP2561146.1 LysR family transcriptional regulator ArgP [Psychrobium sp. 1_MG-2023]PKF55121.1 ArgP/LysG family DNA-binding transcriptional regulator [Alteromonadales bacterium alter-6D02]